MKRGRKISSVHIMSERLMAVLQDQNYSRASIAKAVGSTRESVSRSIRNEWMDEGLLDAICKHLDVAPCYIKGEEGKSKLVFDCNVHEVLENVPVAEYESTIKAHILGYSDDENIPIKYAYKSFPYSYESEANLDISDIFEKWLICIGEQSQLLYFDKFERWVLMDKVMSYTKRLIIEETVKKEDKELERIKNSKGELYGTESKAE